MSEATPAASFAASIIVPTYNEEGNVAELISRVSTALAGVHAELIIVDDSNDETPVIARALGETAAIDVTVIHRDVAEGGLGGAVVAGIRAARSNVCVVMDGDLQHPPEKIPQLLARFAQGDADVVVASRYTGGGTANGLSDQVRVAVSRLSTMVTKAMFPVRLRECSDPMTGFFLVDKTAVDWESLKPRGFKILLEMLARQPLRVAEIPFDFQARHAGESKASFTQGIRFLTQLTQLRFGRMSVFALIGALGAVANVLIMAVLTGWSVPYVLAAIVASVVTIIGNFLLIELFVFRDMKAAAGPMWMRFAKSFTFNAVEAVVRIAALYVVVETWHVSSVLATAVLLAIAFIVRYVFHSLVVYKPRRDGDVATGL
ncbi:glycosyltransferase family 2 protein [Microbacterium mitrae]|uniref:Glycosyltransferase n=1 Tax=Microbacterium mitrae TaxID=664640 RepID=A0A5C8HR93_9MICO|nr:glycosyltransferase [Microbacterium mitrae]TXK06545.1 glycosyltransferase [Microbacterium mitrae]